MNNAVFAYKMLYLRQCIKVTVGSKTNSIKNYGRIAEIYKLLRWDTCFQVALMQSLISRSM